MFFIFSKVLAFFINPLFICLITLFLWWILKKKALKKVFLVSTVILFFLFTNPFLTSLFVGAWKADGTEIMGDQSYDVGILLGGMGKYSSEFKRVGLNSDGDRIWQTLDLYKTGRIKKIWISSYNGSLVSQELNEAKMFQQQLISWRIKPGDVLIEDQSRNTYENAKFTAELIRTSYPHLKTYVLITSAMHMKRAEACFLKQGLKVKPYPTGLSSGSVTTYLDYIVPDASNFELWGQLFKEMTGYLAYKLVGYI